MEEPRKGRQTPTTSLVLPYNETKGPEAVELYNSSGFSAQEWQELLCYDIMAANEDGLWTHTKFGLSVPRRNGKNEVVVMRELWGLAHGEHILHTAHLTSTAHVAWERLLDRCKKAGLKITSEYRASGKEHIYVEGGGAIEFRTRTTTGGLGEGYDLLVIDEAQEYRDNHEQALKYVVSSSQNPQTIMTGTPPTPVSSGTVFAKYRADVLAGKKHENGWAEWGVEEMTDPHDKDAWYECNPSIGFIISERSIADEIGDDHVDFNIQRLGLWIRYNLKSAVSETEWNGCQAEVLPELSGKMAVGIKYGVDGINASMSIAIKTNDGRLFCECIDCQGTRNGPDWIIEWLRIAAPAVKMVVIDGATGQQILAPELKKMKIRNHFPTIADVILANANFEPSLTSGKYVHMDQPSVTQSICHSEHRAIGTNGGYGYKSIQAGVDISIMDSIILALWGVEEFEDAKKMTINY